MFRRRRQKRHVSRSPQKTKRWDMKRKRSPLLKLKQLLAGKFLLFFAIFVLLLGSIYTVFFTPLFLIQDVQVETEYKDINLPLMKKYVEQETLNKNALFLNVSLLENETYDRFPDVSSVACTRQIFSRGIFCEAIGYELIAVIKHEGKKYYINENGVVIAFDNRKLGLPIFDLILNPIFADIESQPKAEVLINEYAESLEKKNTDPFAPLLSSFGPDLEVPLAVESNSLETNLAETDEPEGATDPEKARISFIQPTEAPPIEPLVLSRPREVFQVSVGKKILDPEELKGILEALHELEKVLHRKVIHAQYVQVAGELSLTSKPELNSEEDSEHGSAPEIDPDVVNEEDPEHQFVILLDLRRNLEDQFTKLKKTKEVIDFSQVNQIDLSIDGEKVFYR